LFQPRQKIFAKDVVLLTQALILTTSPDRFDHWSGERCRLGFWFSGAYMAPFASVSGLKRQHAGQAAGFAAVTIAGAVLIGWWDGLPMLSSWGSGFATVKPVTGLCLTALGLAVVHPGKNSRFAFAVGLLVAAVAAVDLGQDLLGFDFGIDRWLMPWTALQRSGAPSFRMINGMPVAIALAGGSLVLSRFEGHHFVATVLAGVAGGMAVFALFAYLSGIDTLHGSASVNAPPLPTAVGVLCIASAIILRFGTMPALRKPRPLWQLHVILGCAVISPLLLFGFRIGVGIADTQLNQVQKDLMSEASTLSANVDRQIIGEIERLQALAASPSLRQGDFAEFQRQAEAALALLQIGNIVLIDRNMQELVNTWVPFGTRLGKAAVSESLVERSFRTGKPQVASLFIGSVTKRLMFGIFVPVQIDGENRYVLGRSQDHHALARLVSVNEPPTGWHAVVSDAAHHIIARSQQEDGFIGKELPPVQWHRAGSGGAFEIINSERRPSLEVSVRSELTGWETAVWAPKALLEAPVRALWRTIGATALLAIALVVGLALWLGRIIARSVGHAARAAIALGEGGQVVLSGTPVAEVDTLMAELRRTAAKRQVADDLLHKSKGRLQLALDAAQLGWWQYDPLHGVFSADTRSKEIFGVTAGATPIEEIMKRVHPDDSKGFWVACEMAFDPADPKPHAIELRLMRENAEVRWIEVHWLAHFEDARGERAFASVIGTVADITERKEREEQVQLLMREVNHRAKNMLSVVDAIAHQTASRNPDDFIKRFSERIQSLSANQDLLVRSDWAGVDIEDLTCAQLAHFADLIGSRIVVDGPKLRLKPASAQAIGLALHELATNAGKYGALSTDGGRVDICWRINSDTLSMSWTERDGPSVSAPKRCGFGTMVMEAMAERSVDGRVDLCYTPSGLTWRLTCPAANALEFCEQRRSGERQKRIHGVVAVELTA
jgi:two-component sensor histidine kinase/PAS domain-containing protein